jgi:hypothetical protein
MYRLSLPSCPLSRFDADRHTDDGRSKCCFVWRRAWCSIASLFEGAAPSCSASLHPTHNSGTFRFTLVTLDAAGTAVCPHDLRASFVCVRPCARLKAARERLRDAGHCLPASSLHPREPWCVGGGADGSTWGQRDLIGTETPSSGSTRPRPRFRCLAWSARCDTCRIQTSACLALHAWPSPVCPCKMFLLHAESRAVRACAGQVLETEQGE